MSRVEKPPPLHSSPLKEIFPTIPLGEETVVYIPIPKKPRKIRPLELHFSMFLQDRGLTHLGIAKRAGLHKETVHNIIRGVTEKPIKRTLQGLTQALAHHEGNFDPHSRAIRKILFDMTYPRPDKEANSFDNVPFDGRVIFFVHKKSKRPKQCQDVQHPTEKAPQESPEAPQESPEKEPPKWYELIDASSLGESVAQLRKYMGITQKEFAARTNLSLSGLSFIETGRRNGTSLPIINAIIEASPLEAYEKAAQRLRLKARKMPVISIESLNHKTLGELMKYLRTIQGLTQEEVGHRLRRSREVIRDIENGEPVAQALSNNISFWLGKSALTEFFQMRIANPQAQPSVVMLKEIANSNHLFDIEDNLAA